MKSLKMEDVLSDIYLCEGSSWKSRDLRSLDEDQKQEVAEKTVTMLFRDIKNKVLNLDFDDVSVGKGDITKIKNYKDFYGALKYLKNLTIQQTKNNIEINDAVNELYFAHDFLVKNKSKFMEGFRLNNNLIIYLFNSISVALVQATSFLIAEGIEIIKDNMGLYDCTIKSGKKLSKNNYLSAIRKFNTIAKNGKLLTCMNSTLKMKNNNIKNEASLADLKILLKKKDDELGVKYVQGALVVMAIIIVLNLIREIVFTIYYTRIRLVKYIEQLKEFVALNASKNDHRPNIKARQEKAVKILDAISNRLAVDQTMASERSENDIKDANKEISNTNTPSSTNKLDGLLF